MALYEPLRESFRELNRLLVDRQQANAQMAAREAQDERDNVMLASQLEQRAFDREMTERRFTMQAEQNEYAKNIDERNFQYKRESTEFEQNIRNKELGLQEEQAKLNEDMQKKRHQLLSDQFDHTKDVYAASEKRSTELHALNLETSRMDRDLKRQQVADLEEFNKQKPAADVLTGSGLFTPEITENSDAMNDIAKLVLGEEHQWNPETQRFESRSGVPSTMSDSQAKQMIPAIISLRDKYEDTPSRIRKNILDLNTQLKEVNNRARGLKKISATDRQFAPQVAKLKIEQQEIARQIGEERNKLSDESILARLEQKRENLSKVVAWAVDKRAPEVAAMFKSDQAALDKRILEQEERMTKQGKELPTQLQYAVRRDKDGNIAETAALFLTKQDSGAIMPWDKDQRLRAEDGWEWAKNVELTKGTLGGSGVDSKRFKSGADIIEKMYGTANTLGGWVIDPAKRDQYQGVLKEYTRLLKSDPKAWPEEIAQKAMSNFQEAYDAFGQTAMDIQQKIEEGGDRAKGEAVLNKMEQLFKEQFGFSALESPGLKLK